MSARYDDRWRKVEKESRGRVYFGYCPKDGATFGDATVITSTIGRTAKTSFLCKCGKTIHVENKLVNIDSDPKCASCAHTERGRKLTIKNGSSVIDDKDLRSIWSHRRTGIISRCYNPECEAYPNYGGRGIMLYEPWLKSRKEWFKYVVTLSDWENPNTDLDRKDNDGHYIPGNLRLVPRKINCLNKRNTVFLEYQGKKYLQEEFMNKFTPLWTRNALSYHLDLGRTIEEALTFYAKYASNSKRYGTRNVRTD